MSLGYGSGVLRLGPTNIDRNGLHDATLALEGSVPAVIAGPAFTQLTTDSYEVNVFLSYAASDKTVRSQTKTPAAMGRG